MQPPEAKSMERLTLTKNGRIPLCWRFQTQGSGLIKWRRLVSFPLCLLRFLSLSLFPSLLGSLSKNLAAWKAPQGGLSGTYQLGRPKRSKVNGKAYVQRCRTRAVNPGAAPPRPRLGRGWRIRASYGRHNSFCWFLDVEV